MGPRPFLAAPNATAHTSTASVPITVLLRNCPLRCSFNVGVKELTDSTDSVNVILMNSWDYNVVRVEPDLQKNREKLIRCHIVVGASRL